MYLFSSLLLPSHFSLTHPSPPPPQKAMSNLFDKKLNALLVKKNMTMNDLTQKLPGAGPPPGGLKPVFGGRGGGGGGGGAGLGGVGAGGGGGERKSKRLCTKLTAGMKKRYKDDYSSDEFDDSYSSSSEEEVSS